MSSPPPPVPSSISISLSLLRSSTVPVHNNDQSLFSVKKTTRIKQGSHGVSWERNLGPGEGLRSYREQATLSHAMPHSTGDLTCSSQRQVGTRSDGAQISSTKKSYLCLLYCSSVWLCGPRLDCRSIHWLPRGGEFPYIADTLLTMGRHESPINTCQSVRLCTHKGTVSISINQS